MKIKLSKSQWEGIGKKAGWKVAQVPAQQPQQQPAPAGQAQPAQQQSQQQPVAQNIMKLSDFIGQIDFQAVRQEASNAGSDQRVSTAVNALNGQLKELLYALGAR